jgi:hypothetical protein
MEELLSSEELNIDDQTDSQLLSLPNEVLALIFYWVGRGRNGVQDLCPSFVICKKCLIATLDASTWKAYCWRDFSITEKDEDTWYETYKGKHFHNTPQHNATQRNTMQHNTTNAMLKLI